MKKRPIAGALLSFGIVSDTAGANARDHDVGAPSDERFMRPPLALCHSGEEAPGVQG